MGKINFWSKIRLDSGDEYILVEKILGDEVVEINTINKIDNIIVFR